ncbi:MAG: hypothetical protein U0575_14580 [Phycisphaerales bacterium]
MGIQPVKLNAIELSTVLRPSGSLQQDITLRNDELHARFPGLMEQLLKHAVAIEWLDSNPDGSDQQLFTCSAFVVSVRGMWFLVTAGHVLDGRASRIAAGRRIASTLLFDACAGNSFPGILIDLEGCPALRHDNNHGWDYGIVLLRPYYAQLLAAGGIKPVSERAWSNQPSDVFARVMLGVPGELRRPVIVKQGSQTKAQSSSAWVLFGLQPARHIPECFGEDRDIRIYGVVAPGEVVEDGVGTPITDIRGTSGGPIFDLHRDAEGRAVYSLVGVQSSWHKPTGTISGTPLWPVLTSFAEGLDAGLRDRHQMGEAPQAANP